MRSEDKCDCKWYEQHDGWEQGWMAPVCLMTKLVIAIGLLFGIGWVAWH